MPRRKRRGLTRRKRKESLNEALHQVGCVLLGCLIAVALVAVVLGATAHP